MARQEQDREDLIAEATALRTRVELTGSTGEEPVILGLRDTGWLSVYFGPDPAYHFDSAGGLRRAFVDGLLYRSQGTGLARLRRDRGTGDRSDLLRSDLDPAELECFLGTMRARLDRLCDAIDRCELTLTRQAGDGEHSLPHLRQALQAARQGTLSAPIARRRE